MKASPNAPESSTTLENYEVYALHYASKEDRQRHENFIATDFHDQPMRLDYYIWVIRNQQRTIVVDTGFKQVQAEARKRTLYRTPRRALEGLGIDSNAVEDVIVTHLHYDHAGSLEDFDAAIFHLQDAEMAFATGRHMASGVFSEAYNVDDVCAMVRKVYGGRVQFHAGDAEIAPGVSLHHIGGHTLGLQSVRVKTQRGWVVLASDAAHFYENLEKTSPFPLVVDVGQMVAGYETLQGLATSHQHIIPGHDPLVREKYPAVGPEFIYRLDCPPRA